MHGVLLFVLGRSFSLIRGENIRPENHDVWLIDVDVDDDDDVDDVVAENVTNTIMAS